MRGKGELLYDDEYDILVVKLMDRDYASSVELDDGDLVLDMDNKKMIIGIRIFDATEVLGMEKKVLKKAKHAELSVKKERKAVMIRIVIKVEEENKDKIKYVQNFNREIEETTNEEPYEVMCTI